MKKFLSIFTILATMCAPVIAGEGTSLSGTLYVYPNLSYVKTNGAATLTAAFPHQLFTWAFTSGTNVNQMNALYSEGPTTLTNGQSKTISLLAATNAFGDVLEFSRVHWIAVKAGTENLDRLGAFEIVGDAFSIGNGLDNLSVYPGGLLFLAAPNIAGYAVATNSHFIVVHNPGTNNATYELYIGGVAE